MPHCFTKMILLGSGVNKSSGKPSYFDDAQAYLNHSWSQPSVDLFFMQNKIKKKKKKKKLTHMWYIYYFVFQYRENDTAAWGSYVSSRPVLE